MAQILPNELVRILNAYYIRLPSNLGVRVGRDSEGGVFTVGTGSWTAIEYNEEEYDTGSDGSGGTYPNGYYDGGVSTTKFTAVTSGFYVISGAIAWTPAAGGVRGLGIYWSDGVSPVYLARDLRLSNGANDEVEISVTTTYWLNAGEWLELHAYQDTGGNLDILRRDNYSPEFSMVRVP